MSDEPPLNPARHEYVLELSRILSLTCPNRPNGNHYCDDYRHIPQAEAILDLLNIRFDLAAGDRGQTPPRERSA